MQLLQRRRVRSTCRAREFEPQNVQVSQTSFFLEHEVEHAVLGRSRAQKVAWVRVARGPLWAADSVAWKSRQTSQPTISYPGNKPTHDFLRWKPQVAHPPCRQAHPTSSVSRRGVHRSADAMAENPSFPTAQPLPAPHSPHLTRDVSRQLLVSAPACRVPEFTSWRKRRPTPWHETSAKHALPKVSLHAGTSKVQSHHLSTLSLSLPPPFSLWRPKELHATRNPTCGAAHPRSRRRKCGVCLRDFASSIAPDTNKSQKLPKPARPITRGEVPAHPSVLQVMLLHFQLHGTPRNQGLGPWKTASHERQQAIAPSRNAARRIQ